MTDYEMGFERGQLRAEEELRRVGFVRPISGEPNPDESERGYVDGWNDTANRSRRHQLR